jgi:hypothetical protein
MSDNEDAESQFVAGHAPALKVGGMRVPKPRGRPSKNTSLGSDEITDDADDAYVAVVFFFKLKVDFRLIQTEGRQFKTKHWSYN